MSGRRWVVAGATGATLVAARLSTGLGGPTLCPLRRLTGVPCPVCGMTRSVGAMTRLQFSEAVGWHPLGPVVVVAALVVALSLVVRIDDVGPSLRVWRDRAYRVAARPLPRGIAVVAVALLWWRQVAHLPSWEAAHGL